MDIDNAAPLRAATHGCPHHVDELVAVALLRVWCRSQKKPLHVTFLPHGCVERRQDEFDVLVDIGGRFDPSEGRFDHHQGGAAVDGRSAAGLLFDELFHCDDIEHQFLVPLIQEVDALDTRDASHVECPETVTGSMFGLSYLLKAVGGYRPNSRRSRECLRLVQRLVDSWFHEARESAQMDVLIASSRKVGRGLFLESDTAYGVGFRHRVAHENYDFVGFPSEPGRFLLVALHDPQGRNRVRFPRSLDQAKYVHPQGFLAVFNDADAAAAALADWDGEEDSCHGS